MNTQEEASDDVSDPESMRREKKDKKHNDSKKDQQLQGLLQDIMELEGVAETVQAKQEKLKERKALFGGKGSGGKLTGRPSQTIQQKIPIECLPKVAIVGQPNVGKSELFNRLTGEYKAIVYDTPGVTRDRMYGRSYWGTKEFVVVDTGGLTRLPEDVYDQLPSEFEKRLPYEIEKQAAAAIEEADAVILVVDGRAGLSAADREIADWLLYHRRESRSRSEKMAKAGIESSQDNRKSVEKPIVLAVNKCESADSIRGAREFWELGIEPFAVSAKHGSGTAELLDALIRDLPNPKSIEEVQSDMDSDILSLAILGRPNVGKSSLLNKLVGEDRAVVSSTAGTTRDAVDTTIKDEESGDAFRLVDTAGIRKRAKVGARSNKDGFETDAVQMALRAMKRADIAVLVLDAQEGVLTQDFRLAELIEQEGRGCVILVNKWDLLPNNELERDEREFKEGIRAQLRPVAWAPIVPVSAHTGKGIGKILKAAAEVGIQHRRTVSTATLNLCIQDALNHHVVSQRGGKVGRVYYGTQVSIRPPTFLLFVNDRQLFAEDEGYKRYLERRLRKDMGLAGTPIRIMFRESNKGGKDGRK